VRTAGLLGRGDVTPATVMRRAAGVGAMDVRLV